MNIYSSKYVTRANGIATYYDGRLQTENVTNKVLVQFEFTGTYFYIGYIPLSTIGGKFKVVIDDIENMVIDSSVEAAKVKIENLSNTSHVVKFVGTGQSSVTASTSYIAFTFVIVPKNIVIEDNGVTGYQTTAMTNLVTVLTDNTVNFVTIMGGLNDRALGGIGETLSSFIGIAEWAKANRKFELIYITPNPAEQAYTTQFNNVAQISRAVKAAADYEDKQCVDVYDYLTRYCIENNKSLSDIANDRLHPNDFGHKLIAGYLLTELGLAPNFIN